MKKTVSQSKRSEEGEKIKYKRKKKEVKFQKCIVQNFNWKEKQTSQDSGRF